MEVDTARTRGLVSVRSRLWTVCSTLWLSPEAWDSASTAPPLDGVLLRKLTRREIEILRLVSAGRSNHDVAKMLFVTDETVKFHLANVYRKLGVHSRFEAARWASDQGLVDLSGETNVVPVPDVGTPATRPFPRRRRAPRARLT